ncbi:MULTISPECIES: substrate-binding periplasmic protein [Shewanella]|uniref:Transporter substrate-binding domain-containing protein n=1 Tax=Shewanella indica TaxID=768528 RepID=A0ABU4QEC5_9GAMM|nr:transporter substrate-binding domain-containing protein [Shewanella indica]MDX6015686.1 transporter substrate-binding domain-containing protein [Shewanella indica]
MIIKFCLTLLTLACATQVFAAENCELTMGYRTNARPPFIAQAPDNSGLYLSLYQEAAARIGCSLKVVRAPKKRILREIAKGSIDFYPGLAFSKERHNYAHFIVNGLSERYIGVSRNDLSDITSLQQLVDKQLVLLISPGSYQLGGLPNKLIVRKPPDMGTDSAITFLKQHQGDFYIYDESTLRYWLQNHPQHGLKLHPNCCDNRRQGHLGFSRNSRYFSAEVNPNYVAAKPISIGNSPWELKSGSIAYALQQALSEMANSGETKRRYQDYMQQVSQPAAAPWFP